MLGLPTKAGGLQSLFDWSRKVQAMFASHEQAIAQLAPQPLFISPLQAAAYAGGHTFDINGAYLSRTGAFQFVLVPLVLPARIHRITRYLVRIWQTTASAGTLNVQLITTDADGVVAILDAVTSTTANSILELGARVDITTRADHKYALRLSNSGAAGLRFHDATIDHEYV